MNLDLWPSDLALKQLDRTAAYGTGSGRRERQRLGAQCLLPAVRHLICRFCQKRTSKMAD